MTTARTGANYVPPAAEALMHDADGNLTSDGRWSYSWDAENRLVTMETQPSLVSAGAPRQRLKFGHEKNGNIMALVNLTTGQAEARYDYGPFGERVLAAGSEIAEANPFRFSTKYEDPETALLYYGYRFYDPVAGRWVNRDPIGERGGVNLYEVTRNSVVQGIDILGLKEITRNCVTKSVSIAKSGEERLPGPPVAMSSGEIGWRLDLSFQAEECEVCCGSQWKHRAKIEASGTFSLTGTATWGPNFQMKIAGIEFEGWAGVQFNGSGSAFVSGNYQTGGGEEKKSFEIDVNAAVSFSISRGGALTASDNGFAAEQM